MRKAILIVFLLLPSITLAQTNYRFTGQELDKASSLHYYNKRYYDSGVGKFTQPDPVALDSPKDYLTDPQQFNSYSYGRDNPVKYIDPTGEKVAEYQPYLPSGQTYTEGEVMGNYRGVKVNYTGSWSGKVDHPYQCTDVAKDFSSNQYNVSLKWTGNAQAYGNQNSINTSFKRNNPDDPGEYVVYQNGGTVMPQEDDIISWSGGSYGHVGVIAEVSFNEVSGAGHIYTVEQNVDGNGLYYQEVIRSYNAEGNKLYTVGSRFSNLNVQGWTRYENQNYLTGQQENYTSILYTPAPQQSINYDH